MRSGRFIVSVIWAIFTIGPGSASARADIIYQTGIVDIPIGSGGPAISLTQWIGVRFIVNDSIQV
jgi:hypothetical protein